MLPFAVLLIWLFCVSLLIYCYRYALVALWREPSLRYPVMIFESDDWGPGPNDDARALEQLIGILRTFQDRSGRHPVMTLGVILAVPDRDRIRREGLSRYYRLTLGDRQFSSIRKAMGDGISAGVFTVQLHGMEHFWPPALLFLANEDERIRDWLTQEGLPNTEELPSHLQSRWTNASKLPSVPLCQNDIRSAVTEEVAAFRATFGHAPAVVVPPTFVWDDVVEDAWAENGVRFVVTPGRRNSGRDRQGAPVPTGPQIRNGDSAAAGAMYVVRGDYFEPAFGHRAAKGLQALQTNTQAGRPTLFETHRFNFTRSAQCAEGAFEQLRQLIAEGLTRFPRLTFLSTEELGEKIRRRDPTLVELRFRHRVHFWLRRIYDVSRLRKLAWLTGLVAIGAPIFVLTRPQNEHVAAL